MTSRFTRLTEDFTCENCGQTVTGNGYTNHCPNCLWSKHVDINPGDRASNCLGLMEPVGVKTKRGQLDLVHQCKKCGHVKSNKLAPADNYDTFLAIASGNS